MFILSRFKKDCLTWLILLSGSTVGAFTSSTVFTVIFVLSEVGVELSLFIS
jgi:hypothetical protein